MNESEQYQAQREHMVTDQIARRGICTPNVLAAMRAVPRHLFIPSDQRYWAYSDGALRIGMGQTISQPYIVALMTDLLQLEGGETVLEVGTGSGYQAAVLAQIVSQVYTIERHQTLADGARQLFAELGISNVDVQVGDGSLGLPESAPFQGILVTAAAPKAPPALLNQLAEGGRLVLPVGGKFSQMLEVWLRKQGQFIREAITAVAFVPLLGAEGWDEEKWDRKTYWW